MGMCVCMGANLQCSFGAAPSTLIVNSQSTVLVASKPAATIMDSKPMGNIPPSACAAVRPIRPPSSPRR